MNRKLRHVRSAGNVRIAGGEVLPRALARIVCRCAECLAPVWDRDNALVCQVDPEHTGLIHRRAAAEEQARREQALQDVESAYAIVDGQILPKVEIISARSSDNAN